MSQDWENSRVLGARRFTCGHVGCGANVSSSEGLKTTNNGPGGFRIYICPDCARPTLLVVDGSIQIPGVRPGREISGLPGDVVDLYGQARDAYANQSYTAAVLAIRKILMHIAVEKGAAAGQTFVTYVDHLVANGWAPPGSKPWVDHIRTRGNEENHEIVLATQDDATELLAFLEMLLTFMYEFPSRVPGTAGSPPPSSPA